VNPVLKGYVGQASIEVDVVRLVGGHGSVLFFLVERFPARTTVLGEASDGHSHSLCTDTCDWVEANNLARIRVKA
jgi:hypothetical protein